MECILCGVFKKNVNPILWMLLFLIPIWELEAQVVKGKITDEQTGEPLPFANVFISNTTFGSTTDIDGNFEISGQLPQNFELAASFIGYYTKFRNIALSGRNSVTVNFDLTPKVDQLDEIQLKSRRDKKWERNLKRFERVFLAVLDDPFLKKSKITNPWILDFQQGREGGMRYFAATAQDPILIENEALGYHIEYHLQRFVETRRGFQYYGLVNFSELEGVDGKEDLRNTTYQGSLRHFVKSLVDRTVDTLEYEIYQVIPDNFLTKRTNDFTQELGESIVKIHRDSLYICDLPNGLTLIELPYKIEVHNRKKPWPNNYYENIYHSISWLEAPEGYFVVDDYGVLPDPTQLERAGNMGRERVARFLPHDFEPTGELGEFVAEFDSTLLRKSKWNNLREKPHLSLNKTYYHPGEAIWFAADMLYQNNFYMDSLSRVLHVEVYDNDFQTILSEKFQIKEGKSSGVLVLPDGLQPDNYVIRAYTNWMRNYQEDGFSYVPIPVLGSNEKLVAELVEEEFETDEDLEVIIKSQFEKSIWNTKVKLEIDIIEADDEIVGGQFSISVLDADLNPEIFLQSPIRNSLNWLLSDEKSIFYEEPKYPIEFGISLQGYFSDRPRRPLNVPLTIVQGELEDYGIIQTDSSGYFWATGLVFQDSAEISIAALNKRRNSFGEVRLAPSQSPNVQPFYPRFSYGKETIENPDVEFSFEDLMAGNYMELEEITVQTSALESTAERNYGYGTPDREIDSQFLESRPDLTLDRVISMNMAGGRMGNYNWGLDAGEPLLMVDGARFFPSEDESVFAYLSTFVAAEVESIKIYTFSAGTFGLQGFAGAILVETKRAKRGLQEDQVFDASQFQKFKVSGFTAVPQFPVFNNHEGIIKQRSAIYWNPRLEWDQDQTSIPITFEMSNQTQRILVKIEGLSKDKDPISKIIEIRVEDLL